MRIDELFVLSYDSWDPPSNDTTTNVVVPYKLVERPQRLGRITDWFKRNNQLQNQKYVSLRIILILAVMQPKDL